MVKTIGIIALKGGVGKTTTVAAIGATLVKHFNKKVLIVDANFSAPNLGIHLGIFNPNNTLHDVFSNNISIKDAIYKTDYGVDIIPGSLIGTGKDAFALKNKLKNIKNDYDIVLLDSSPNLNQEILATMVASDELYVVTTPDFPTLSCTLKAVKVANQKKTPIKGLILNKVRNRNFELSLQEIEEASESKVLAVLPDEVHILEALSKSLPSTLHKHNSDSTIEYKKLAAFLIGEQYKDIRLKSLVRNFINRSYPLHDLNKKEMINDVGSDNKSTNLI
jgi:septum site-determining protein MinD